MSAFIRGTLIFPSSVLAAEVKKKNHPVTSSKQPSSVTMRCDRK